MPADGTELLVHRYNPELEVMRLAEEMEIVCFPVGGIVVGVVYL
jgi:hypothetical protein